MPKRLRVLLSSLLLSSSFILFGCDQSTSLITNDSEKKPELVIYSGITMVKPIQQLANEFEQKHNINITIKQGASGFLYESLKKERKGDIYFPGSDSFRLNNQQDGLLTDYVFVGYNRIAIIVAKGNPKKLTNDLTQLKDPDLSVVLSTPTSGAIGKAGKELLDKLDLTDDVFKNVTYFTTDSHRLLSAIKYGDADVVLNWFATAKWQNAQEIIDVIEIDPHLNKPKRLELNLLSFSTEKVLAKQFMDFAGSEQGLEVFYKFGFLTDDEIDRIIDKQKDKR